MRVTYYLNAMLLLESSTTRVLCDPWVTFNNQSDSYFYNFPKSKLTKKDVAQLKPDFIYISHTHPDHFDPATLSLFSKSTPFLVAPYENNFTERSLKSLGYKNVHVVPKDTGLALNGSDYCWLDTSAHYPKLIP